MSTSAETVYYIESAVPYSDHQICSIQPGNLEKLKSVEVSWFLVSHFTLSPHSARLIGSVQCLECQSADRVTLITPPPGAFIAELTQICPFSVELEKNVREVSTITEKAPTKAFSWLKLATTALTFKTLLRHYDKQLTPTVSRREIGSPTQKS